MHSRQKDFVFSKLYMQIRIVYEQTRFEDKIVTVTYNDGSVKHAAGKRHSRFIKGDEQNELMKQFYKGPDMWIEDQVRLWHHRCGDDISCLDAAGTIVANHNGKKVLY